MEKRRIKDYWNLGTAIGFCTAVGIMLGALFQNVVTRLYIGAGVGVVLGAISVNKKSKEKQTADHTGDVA